nr:hypothetical protein [uncultured Flavobacterium sp.]
MMELPFNSIEIIQNIDREPGLLVAFAAFHPIALLLVLLLSFWILKKTGLYTPKENYGIFGVSVTIIILIGWILGFASQILLLFTGVTGLRMLLIYLSMYLCITAFVIFNAKSLQKKFLRDTAKRKIV